MGDKGSQDRLLDGIGWGMLLVWWGLSFVPHFLPNGLDAAGTGLILLGISAVRKAQGLKARGFVVGFGVLTLVWGALDLTRSVLHLDWKPPVVPILLALAGLIVLAGVLIGARRSAAHAPTP